MQVAALKTQLLDLLSSKTSIDQGAISRLSDDDWTRILVMARQHRVLPELRWRLQHTHPHLVLPDEVAAQLSSAFEHSTMRSLVLQRELIRINRILGAANIPHAMLKGAFLAFFCYPNPGQRPLRDIDVLVPKEHALPAYRALCDAGMLRTTRPENAARLKFDHSGDAPDLFAPGNILVELHTRLFGKPTLKQTHADLSRHTGFWDRIVFRKLGSAAIPFLSPTDLLIHLIVHSAYDHHFSNGPLTFNDIAYLVRENGVDWSLFWRLADFTGSRRACVLVLKTTESLHGDLGINLAMAEEDVEALSGDVLDTVPILSLNNLWNKDNFLLRADLDLQPNAWTRLKAVFRRAFPSRQVMSETYLVPARSPVIYALYPVKWYDIVVRRLPAIISSGRVDTLRDEQRLLNKYRLWLSKD